MLAFCALGFVQLWQDNGDLTVGLGLPGIATWTVWALYGLVAVLVVVLAQRFAHRPASGVLLALAWGGLAATWAATAANSALSEIFLRTTSNDPTTWLSAPVVEESVKALGVIGLVLIPILRRFRALDGLFYGVLVGAGFQIVEDAIYTISALFSHPGNPTGTIVATLVLRGLTIGLFTHAVYTGLIGAAIGWAASAPVGRRARRSAAAVVVVILMMVVHGEFNTQDDIDPITITASLGVFVVLLVAIVWARRDELACLARDAVTGGGWGVLTADEIASIDGPKPEAKPARKLRDRVRSFAWAADHLGVDHRRAQEDAAAVAAARATGG
jgi:RsiW-degrading membrane proteinase PrsW (M82 family)